MHIGESIEVSLLQPKSTLNINEIKDNLMEVLKQLPNFQTILPITTALYPELAKNVKTVIFNEKVDKIPNDIENMRFYYYYPHQRSSEDEMIETSDNEEETCASNHWILPNVEYEGLYESLIYDDDVKEQILTFAESAIVFGNFGVDKNLVSFNRLILLHGPPGTGKTSLCKAISQKLSIRLNSIYKFTHLIEINCHSLFSKWFSESGKLVAKLFGKIREMIMQPKCLVCILIDEVESIAYDRCNLAGEPKDALRVVNAVLTQLDQLRHYSNVMIFATSNLMNTIDIAFIDRVDLKKLIGFPSEKAIYNIYLSAINDLIRVGLLEVNEKDKFKNYGNEKFLEKFNEVNDNKYQSMLKEIVIASNGLSGRCLRKIPFLAHTFGVYTPGQSKGMDLDIFLTCMLKAACEQNSSS